MISLLLSNSDTSTDVDPATWSVDRLINVRGAMWTARMNLPYGPRPYQDSNILNISQAYLYPNAEQVIVNYAARGYTHADTGPLPMGEGGYHGDYPDTFDYRNDPDRYLDFLQLLWNYGICPIFFAKPDNWTIADLDNNGLTTIYSSARFNKLVRIVVPRGWEPSQDDSNATYIEGYQWSQRVFPKALTGLHMTADFDAPGNNEDLTPGTPAYIGNDGCWNRLAPYLHLWFVQNAGYVYGGSPIPSAEFVKNFGDQFDPNTRGSLADRFQHGYANWPTFSAFGPNEGIKVVAGEFAAYGDYHFNYPEEEARKLGDIAIARGAQGSLDGCFTGKY